MKLKTLGLIALLAISGCTSYQESGWTGGFTDTQLDENVWEVSFSGNGYTSAQRVRDFALLRASEIALTNGYAYFAVADDRDDSKTSTQQTEGRSSYSASCAGNMCSGAGTYTPGTTYDVRKHGNSRIAIMYRDKPADTFVYNAQMIFDSIVASYDLEDKVDPDLLTGI